MKLKKLNITAKFMIGVALLLTVLMAVNVIITNKRVNNQAERAFANKLRQITGMATETRAWVAAHQEIFNKVNESGNREINTVPVVAAWKIAQDYAREVNYEFKTPSLSPRNPKNAADEFEREALLAFEKNPSLTEYIRREKENGKEFFRYAVPVKVEKSCLECHGFPVGELDPFGYPKEGMKVGDIRAAFAVKAPADELLANEASNTRFGLVAGFITLLFVSIGIYYMTRRHISRPLEEISQKMVAISKGDVNQSINYTSEDEIGTVARAFGELTEYLKNISKSAEHIANGDLTVKHKIRSEKDLLGKSFVRMIENLSQLIKEVTDNSASLVSAATQIASSAEQTSKGAIDQSEQVSQVSAAVEQMTATIVESSRNSGEASEVSRQAADTAASGGQIVSDTIRGMQRIADVVRESADSIGKLAKSADQIGEIISVIDDIADQTNLLALNAAIEAARAGELGRGFAVVADEVRKLAERTSKATGEITDMIKGIQSQTEDAVQSMEAGIAEVDKGRELTDKAGASLNEIATMSERVMDMIQQIANAAEQQSTAAEEISRSIEHISTVTHESAKGAEQSAQAAEDLNRQAENLRNLVSRFKVS